MPRAAITMQGSWSPPAAGARMQGAAQALLGDSARAPSERREAQRKYARRLRLLLTARACRRINNVLRERKQTAARKTGGTI